MGMPECRPSRDRRPNQLSQGGTNLWRRRFDHPSDQAARGDGVRCVLKGGSIFTG